MENIFVVMNYEDLRKVQFVTFKLLVPARDWSLRKKEEYEIEHKEWVWTEFLAEFTKQFIPR
jgi:hypothetical protein